MENELKATIILILLSFIIGAYAYALLPAQVASHWGISGTPNGYMPAVFGAFLFPALMVVLFAIFMVIPLIDPLRANIETFRKEYYGLILAITGFFFIVYLQTILWNLGIMISFSLSLPILLGCLFFYLGTMLGKAKRNFFIGIRTPWTLYSDKVWDKTHKLGATVFEAIGILFVLSVLLPAYSLVIVIGLFVAALVGLVLYSYVEYTKLKKAYRKRGKRRKPLDQAM
jgi:uncharacterized membrane protein